MVQPLLRTFGTNSCPIRWRRLLKSTSTVRAWRSPSAIARPPLSITRSLFAMSTARSSSCEPLTSRSCPSNRAEYESRSTTSAPNSNVPRACPEVSNMRLRYAAFVTGGYPQCFDAVKSAHLRRDLRTSGSLQLGDSCKYRALQVLDAGRVGDLCAGGSVCHIKSVDNLMPQRHRSHQRDVAVARGDRARDSSQHPNAVGHPDLDHSRARRGIVVDQDARRSDARSPGSLR